MQALRNRCLKVFIVLQACYARFAVPGIGLALAIAVVAFVLHLAGQAHVVTTLLPHVTGHAHATQQLVGDTGPWPPSPGAST
jgi:hypothetical protein